MSKIRKRHSPEVVYAALESIQEKRLSLRKASLMYGIPVTTLRDKLTGRRPIKPYGKNLLSVEEEDKLAKWLIELAKRGFGKTRDEVRLAAKQILDTRDNSSKSKTDIPSSSWTQRFFIRHPELTLRSPQSLEKERALVNSLSLEKWFRDFKCCIESIDPTLLDDPKRIYNADETGFFFDAKSRKVTACKGSKHVYNVTANVKTQVTVLACASAGGHFLSPLLIYPYKRIPTKSLLEHFPEAILHVSDNGWITTQIFYSWLRDSFIPATAHVQKPIVLLVDGHSSHTGLVDTSQLCHDNQIVLYCLLPHASHLIQPLDQAFFGAIEPAWSDAIRQHVSEHGDGVNLESFAKVLRPVWLKVTTPTIAAQSFKEAGIIPFDPDRVIQSPKLGANALFSPESVNVQNVVQPYPSIKIEPTGNEIVPVYNVHIANDSQTNTETPSPVNEIEPIIKIQNITNDTQTNTEIQLTVNKIEPIIDVINEIPPITNITPNHTINISSHPSIDDLYHPSSTSHVEQSNLNFSAAQLKLKALQEYSCFLYDEMGRNQFTHFFGKLTGATDRILNRDEEQKFETFKKLAAGLIETCVLKEPENIKASPFY